MLVSRRLAYVVLALVLGALRVSAQTCSTGTTGNLTLSVTPASVALPSPATADYNGGFSQTGSFTVKVTPAANRKNYTWYLCIQATSANMGTVNGYTKPIGDLQYSLNGGPWTSLSTALAQMSTGSGTTTWTLAVRSKLAWALDQPSSPTVPFTYAAHFNVQAAF